MVAKEHWGTIEEVASYLGVTKYSVYRWIENKSFPAHRVCRLFCFKPSEVELWVSKGGGALKRREHRANE